MHRRQTLLLLGGGAAAVATTAAAAPLRALNLLASWQPATVTPGLAYGTHPRQRLDLFQPARPAPGAPLVVFFYGGSWNRGERADYRFVGRALAARGLVAVVADYRLYPEVRYPDFLHDAAAALVYARARAQAWGAHPGRVVLAGHSAGAYIAAMLALDARWGATAGLAGWVGLAGPYNFLPIGNPEVQPVFGHPAVPPDSQPLVHAARSRLPALLLAAAEDKLVNPQRNSATLAAALRAAGAPVQVRLLPGLDHATLLAALAWPLQRWDRFAPVLHKVAGWVHALPVSGQMPRAQGRGAGA